MSRIIPEKIQDIEKGVEGAENRTPDKSKKEQTTTTTTTEGENQNQNKEKEKEEILSENGNENENGEGKKKRVNFNEEANISWERESIIHPDDSTDRHSNIMVISFFSFLLFIIC